MLPKVPKFLNVGIALMKSGALAIRRIIALQYNLLAVSPVVLTRAERIAEIVGRYVGRYGPHPEFVYAEARTATIPFDLANPEVAAEFIKALTRQPQIGSQNVEFVWQIIAPY